MRLRRLALAVGLTSAFGANMVAALGLGEIKLLSNLNQPLEAEIKLLEVRDLSENEILVGLASRDEFQRVGIERPFFLTELKFEVDLKAASGPVIRVSSRKPVREPYLNFLLESQWPNGRLMREYTVLLDLPVYADSEAAKPVGAARSASAAPKSNRPRAAAARPTSSGDGRSYGPVSATDTLWDIALRVRPDNSYSVHKTMLAIQRLNPDAFINGNINLLKRGQVLRVPQGSEIDEVTQQQALNEVAYQNSNWDNAGSSAPLAPQLDASPQRATPSTTSTSVEGRLKVAGDSDASQGSGVGTGSGSGSQQGLSQQLSVSLEELDKARRENSDLKDRVSQLEEQLRTMERLVEVSSEEMRALQLQAAASGEALPDAEDVKDTVDDVIAGATDEGSDAALENEPSPAAGSSAQSDTTDAANAASAAAKPAKVDPTKVVRSAPKKEPTWVDALTNNILYIGGALVAILAAVLFLLKRKSDDEETELTPVVDSVSTAPAEEPNKTEELPDETVAMATAAVTAAVAQAQSDEDLDEPDVDVTDEAPLFAEADDDSITAETPVESQTDDVVGEADIYIAYGKLDQAKEMLLGALASNPDHTAARLKLMEVYAEDNDASAFEEEYAKVAATGDDVAVARAEDLRLHFEDVLPAAEDELALDLALDDGPEEESSAAVSDDSSTEFSLDLPDQGDSEADTDEEELTLDIADLELDEEPLESDGTSTESELEALEDELSLEFESATSSVDDEDKLELSLDLEDDPELDQEPALLDDESLDLEDDSATDFSLDFEPSSGSDEPAEGAAEDESFDAEDFSALEAELDEALEKEDGFELDLSAESDEPVALDEATLDEVELDEVDLELSLEDGDLDLSPEVAEQSDVVRAMDERAAEDGLAEADSADEIAIELDGDDGAFLEADPNDVTLSYEVDPALLDLESNSDLDAHFEESDDIDLDELDKELEALSTESQSGESEPSESDLEIDVSEEVETPIEEPVAESSSSDVFEEALADLPTPEDVMADSDSDEGDLDEEFDFMADADEVATKLDLARAYIDMGDHEGARDILGEVVDEGDDQQRQDAQNMLATLS